MALRYWIGIVLILLGIGFVLDQTQVISFGETFGTFWPVLLIMVGIGHLVRKNASYVWGTILVLVGVLFQLQELDLLPVDFHALLWPSIIIIVGLSLLLPRGDIRRKAAMDSSESFQHTAVFSGVDAASDSASFKGGAVSAVFGGADIDLTQAQLDPEGAYLELTAVFGGIDIRVPRDWRVQVTGVPVFGGWDAKVENRVDKNAEGPVLRIHCTAMFGGIDIKN